MDTYAAVSDTLQLWIEHTALIASLRAAAGVLSTFRIVAIADLKLFVPSEHTLSQLCFVSTRVMCDD